MAPLPMPALRLVSERDPSDVLPEDLLAAYERISAGPLSVVERARAAALRTMLGIDEP